MTASSARIAGPTIRGFLVGATGVGKTEVAVWIARRLDLEILGVDSRQIYRRLEIGTAKPTREERAAAKHHLIDRLEPDEAGSAGRYLALFSDIVAELGQRGINGLAVGGAGLYVDACLGRLHALPERDEAIRQRLREEEAKGGIGSLHRRLVAVDPESGKRISPRDLQRVIRALEVAELTGRPLSSWFAGRSRTVISANTPVLHLVRERSDLRTRIESRCRRMVEDGLPEEVEELLGAGLSPDAPGLRTLGYAEWVGWIQRRWSREEASTRFLRNTWKYARRQETWFGNRHPHRYVIEVERDEVTPAIGERVLAFLEKGSGNPG